MTKFTQEQDIENNMSVFFENVRNLGQSVSAKIAEFGTISSEENAAIFENVQWTQKMANRMLEEIKEDGSSYGMGIVNEQLDLACSRHEVHELVYSWDELLKSGEKKLHAQFLKERRAWRKAGGHITIAEAYEMAGIEPTPVYAEPVELKPITIAQALERYTRYN